MSIVFSHFQTSQDALIQDFYKKNVNFKVLGPVGDIIEKWTLYGTYIGDATFGDLDFGDSAPVEIALQLVYDYAILEF